MTSDSAPYPAPVPSRRLLFALRLVIVAALTTTGAGSLLFAHAPREKPHPRFRTLGWGAAPSDLFYSYQGKDHPLHVSESGRSVFHPAPGSGPVPFYRIVPKADGTAGHVTAAVADLTGLGPSPLLILTPSRTDPAGFETLALADDLAAFPERGCRFVNLTAIPINATVGEATVSLPPGESRLIVPPSSGARQAALHATVFVMAQGSKVMLAYNNWVFRPGQRTLVIIATDHAKRPKVVRLVEGTAILDQPAPPADQ